MNKLEKPKCPLSAYNLFFRDERAKILKENQDTKRKLSTFGQLGKMIGERWNSLDSAIKSEYENEAKKTLKSINTTYRNFMSSKTQC